MEKVFNPIYLSVDDFDKLSKFELGHGTDGGVYRIDKNTLIKLYHKSVRLIKDKANVSDDSDMKFYDKKNIKQTFIPDAITYYRYTDEDIKVRSKDAIYKAIERQEAIKRTHLPKEVVYLNKTFAGCVLQYIKGIQIHKLHLLPVSKRKQIMKEVLLAVKELMDNYIYHVDLSNSPYSKKLFINPDGVHEHLGHSHVLVDPFTLKPQIIDVDGKSTIYMERKSTEYEELTMVNVSILLIEFLVGLNTDEFAVEDGEFEYLESELARLGIAADYVSDLSKYQITIDEAMEIVDSYGRSLKRV